MGRIGMTIEYTVQWPWHSGILPSTSDVVLKWTHSILQEDDYCSEWVAAHRATELALQFGSSTFQPPRFVQTLGRRHEGRACVTFCPNVEVFLGEEDSIDMHAVTVPAEALSTSHKPWSDHFQPLGTKMSKERFCFDRDLACPVPELFAAFLHPSPFQSLPSNCFGLCCDPLSPCEAVSIPKDHDPYSLLHNLELFTQVFTSKVISNPNDCPCPLASGISQSSHEGYVTCPGSDAPVDEGPPDASQIRMEASGSVPSSATSPIRLPPFAQQMMVNLPLEFLTNPVRIVQGFVVRTWYLHHVNIPLSLQARQSLMTGPPHVW
jgi:hypothetical protein